MRLILEKNEIIRILGKHFDAELDPDRVIIRTDPFEVELSGIPLAEGEPAQEEPRASPKPAPALREGDVETGWEVAARADANAFAEDPEPGVDGESGDDLAFNPAAVLGLSQQLMEDLDKKNPNLVKSRGKADGSTRLPGDFRDEIG